MTLPRVLIIDDQCGWDSAYRKTITKRAGLLISGSQDESLNYIAEVTICSGQTKANGSLVNDYEVIHKAVAGTAGNGAEWSLVLLDVQFDSGKIGDNGLPSMLPGDESFGERMRPKLLEEFPGLPLIMFTGKHQSELTDVVDDSYLSKSPLTPRDFATKLLKFGRLTPNQKIKLLGLDSQTIAASPLTIKLYREALENADKDAPVLILGESGVGKEVLARYVHDKSNRSQKSFVAINVSAIPESLVESELFGIEGRVASNVDRRMGYFEVANGGTLFLDEIGDMPLSIQTKVLRVLQENEFVRVGSREPIPLNIRVIAATSRDMGTLIAKGEFRWDLFRRIGGVTLTIPPLRERKEDVVPLAESFIQHFALKYKKVGIVLGPEAKRTLCHHPFFGNVGELEHIIHRLVSTVGNNRVISDNDMEEALASSMSMLATPQDKSALPDARLPHTRSDAVTPTTHASLEGLIRTIESFQVDMKGDLKGAKQKIEEALQILLKKLAGATLELYRDQRTGEFNRQGAMQHLTGNNSLKGKGVGYEINKILGRNVDIKITDEELESLVSNWRENN